LSFLKRSANNIVGTLRLFLPKKVENKKEKFKEKKKERLKRKKRMFKKKNKFMKMLKGKRFCMKKKN